MNNYELSKLKRSVIAKTWLEEKRRICQGEGTRNWSVIQQDDILHYNFAIGFVGQFLSDTTDEANMRVQFVEMSIEFLSAHDHRKNNRKTGRVNTDNYTITPSLSLPVIKLSEPSYLGYFDSHRWLFAGQDIGFGIAVMGTNPSNKIDANSNNNRFGINSQDSQVDSMAASDKNSFGINNQDSQADSTATDSTKQRMENYGF